MNEIIFNMFYGLAHQSRALDIAITFLAQYFPFVVLSVLLVYLFEHRDDPKKGVRDLFVVGATAVAAYVIAYAFKYTFDTARPFDAWLWVKPLVAESGPAFPSGHATFFMALASSLWFYHKRLAVFFGVIAVIVGLARVAAGVHWPVDILGGLLLGYILGISAYYLLSYLLQKSSKSVE